LFSIARKKKKGSDIIISEPELNLKLKYNDFYLKMLKDLNWAFRNGLIVAKRKD